MDLARLRLRGRCNLNHVKRNRDGVVVVQRDLEAMGTGTLEDDPHRAQRQLHVRVGRPGKRRRLHLKPASDRRENLSPVRILQDYRERVLRADLDRPALDSEAHEQLRVRDGKLWRPKNVDESHHAEFALSVDGGVVRESRECDLHSTATQGPG